MKAEGGVVEMKDKAVNMYRDTQGIEPFIKYMVQSSEGDLDGRKTKHGGQSSVTVR